MSNYYIYNTSIGKLCFVEVNNKITHIVNSNFNLFKDNHNFSNVESPLIQKAHIQIAEYLKGSRIKFDLPLNPKGTNFQIRVWKSLLKIPYGETRSYKDIAISIGNEKSSRAVGNANGNNPILIVIPCHRVISSDGSLGGYSSGIQIKKHLLNLERCE